MARSIKLIAVVLTIVAIGGVSATGAFASVDATRTAQVTTAGDKGALLQLEPTNTNSDLVTQSSDVSQSSGTIELDLNNLNLNAKTDLGEVIRITNNGDDDITLDVSVSGNQAGDVTITTAGGVDSGTDLTGNSVGLGAGEKVTIAITIDTKGLGLSSDTQIVDSITFDAS